MRKLFVLVLILGVLFLEAGAISADETIQITYGGELVAGGLGVKRVVSGTGTLTSAVREGDVTLLVPAPPGSFVGTAYIGLGAGETIDTTKCLFFIDVSGDNSSAGDVEISYPQPYANYFHIAHEESATKIFSFQIVEFK